MGVKVPVAPDRRMGITLAKRQQQLMERMALGVCPGIGRTPFLVYATHIANADRELVVALAVRTHPLLRATLFYGAIEVNQVVIANPVPASLAVPAIHLGSADLPAGGCSCAMDNE